MLAQVTGSFGLKGFVKVRLSTDSPARLKSAGRVLLGKSASSCREYHVEAVQSGGRNILVKFREVGDRTAAGLLSGSYIFVEESRRATPPKGSYLVDEIIGCTVTTADGSVVGTVEDVYKMPAQDVWVVRSGTKVGMIPAVKEFIKSVDIARRRIVVELIEGMIGGE
jgi:16S rRNA processing protein RimM